jgi:AraC-like DNA-binding protein
VAERHGVSWRYKRGLCDCAECKRAAQLEQKRYRLRVQRGEVDTTVLASKSRKRLKEMHNERGWSYGYIAKELGMNRRSVQRLSYNLSDGGRKRVMKSTADKIEELWQTGGSDEQVDNRGLVPARLTVLCLRGMSAQGWTQVEIAARLGGENLQRHIGRIMQRKFVTVETEEKVLALAREIGHLRGSSERCATAAAKKGWKPLLYIDEVV